MWLINFSQHIDRQKYVLYPTLILRCFWFQCFVKLTILLKQANLVKAKSLTGSDQQYLIHNLFLLLRTNKMQAFSFLYLGLYFWDEEIVTIYTTDILIFIVLFTEFFPPFYAPAFWRCYTLEFQTGPFIYSAGVDCSNSEQCKWCKYLLSSQKYRQILYGFVCKIMYLFFFLFIYML